MGPIITGCQFTTGGLIFEGPDRATKQVCHSVSRSGMGLWLVLVPGVARQQIQRVRQERQHGLQ